MRDEIKATMSDLAKGSQEYNRLNAMQLVNWDPIRGTAGGWI
jgi:hypothetical protein